MDPVPCRRVQVFHERDNRVYNWIGVIAVLKSCPAEGRKREFPGSSDKRQEAVPPAMPLCRSASPSSSSSLP